MKRYWLLFTLLFALACQRVFAGPAVSSVVNTHLKDLSATATMGQANHAALAQISKDFANAYRFKTMQTYFQEPGRIRFEMKAFGVNFTYVINGNTKYTSVPQLRIHKASDISRRPETRQNAMELGLLTPSGLNDFTAKFLRKEGSLLVFELRYKQQDQRSKKIVLWADPAKKVITRRDLYRGDGSLKVRYEYLSPAHVNGVWVPTRITVYNARGQFGGVTTYHNIRVNTGLSGKLFQGA